MGGDGGPVPVFLTSGQQTSTTVLLAEAAAGRGMEVRSLAAASALTGLSGSGDRAVHWYGGPLAYDHRIAGALGLGLLEPPDDWLAALPEEFTGRHVELTTLAEAWRVRRPVFVKPPSAKSFPAAVYADGSRLPRTGDTGDTGEAVGPDTPVLVSDIVTFAVEYRLFVLDGRVVTGSRYTVFGRLDPAPLDGDGRESEVLRFADQLLTAEGDSLPSAVAVDVGLIQDPDRGGRERWAVVEANMPWFSHSYAARVEGVLDVVLRAAGPRGWVRQGDERFVRGTARVQ
ncbi:ATP-grasp domain-containing protein [Streptomyces sp. SID12501]|uniref:ATP-grasp domain-containing protein n=1 Tax=Streptomyces sp. SID12501 TaxID=2706042 RepID=A0A6B3C5V4_9ACTN|nr:ATP-grasp domain-containing protein [Streptomyces sp. SID12501]NEC91702.1 ATP-grasp domain-containing protein [Streptomyces sp. SID12501]